MIILSVSANISILSAYATYNQGFNLQKSPYINASYNIACPAEITLTPSVGFTPWKGMYDADGAAFTDIALKASKNINITDHFSLPLFVQAIVSPSFDKTYLIAGLSIGF